MKKKQVVIVMFAAAMAALTGCSGETGAVNVGNTQEVMASEVNAAHKQENQSATVWNIPETYTKTIGNAAFNFTVQFPEKWKNSKVYKTKAERITFTKEKLEQALGKVSYDYEKWQQNKEGGFLSADDYGIMYETELGEHIINCVDLDARDGNMDKYKTNAELSFMTKQEAYENILNTLKEMGLELEDATYICYALEHKTMQSQEYVMDADGNQMEEYKKKDWNSEDDCYLFLIRQKVQGATEYHTYGTEFVRMEEGNAPIQVYYSKNGMERLDIEKVYRFTKEEETLTLLDFEEITKSVAKELENRNATSSYRVISAELCLKTPDFGSEMTPVWVFQSEEITTEGTVYPVTVVINAQNGKLSAMGTR